MVTTIRKQKTRILRAFWLFGAGTKSRTRDLLITSQLLYQLSYAGNRAGIIKILIVTSNHP